VTRARGAHVIARAVLATLMLTTACSANWQPLTLVQPRPIDRKEVLEFRAKNQLVRLHGVQFSRDSLSGIPWLEHLSCDSCRVSYALSDVTQVRTGHPGNEAWVIGGPMLAVVGGGVLVAFLMAASFRGD
jgi:hypothetical protein